MNDPLIFEYPLKEQLRSFLRLESLFNQCERNRLAQHPDNHQHLLKMLFEILEMVGRGDTRAELTKELSRLSAAYTLLKNNHAVDQHKLDNFLKQINQLNQWLVNYHGKLGDNLRKNQLLETIHQRICIIGGSWSIDCPELFLFLNQDVKTRQTALAGWLNDLAGVKTSIEVVLRLIRESGHWQSQIAPLGSFMVEDNDQHFQLLRVRLDRSLNLFPEFSGGKHRSNIQFMRFSPDTLGQTIASSLYTAKKIPQQREIQFELACC